MVALSLKIGVGNVVKTMQFEPSTMVYDACRIIRERVPEAQTGQPNDYGLFLSDEDPKKGIWLESGKALDYYMLRNGDTLDYKKKHRPLKIRMLDGTVKTVMVDDSKIVGDMLMTICARIANDYGLFLSDEDPKKGIWLESGKALDYYMLRNGDTLDYKKKHRPLKIRMLDGTVKTVMVDDSKIVGDMLMTICARIGITNYDEYSLVHDIVEEKKEENYGTLKKDKTLMRDEKKMEKLKQKLHTDDDMNWLDHGRTLREQGVEETETLLLRRKFFYSDQNVDSRDPVQLNLLYVQEIQTTEGEQIAQLIAGYIDIILKKKKSKDHFGLEGDEESTMLEDSVSPKNLKEFLPKEYIKNKGEKKIFQAHNNSQSMTEIEAKVSYVKLARSLKTYGVSFFLVKKKSKDHFGLEGDEESTMLEDSVSPKKSTVLQQQFNRVGKVEHGSVALPAIMRSGAGGPESFQVGTMPQAKQHITSGQMHRGHMPPLASKAWRKNKMDESKHEIHSQVDAITAGTASVVNLTAGGPADTDYTAVGCAVTTISSNLTEMSKGVKLLAALVEDEGGNGHNLLHAAKNLACAVSDMLKTAQPASTEPRQVLLQAAGNVGQASGDLLQQIGESEADQRFQDMLMHLAKAVANAAAALVLKAKNVAQKTEDSGLQNRVIAAATQCALSTSQLVACTRVVAPTISSPVCQEQLIEAGKLVAKSVEGCVEASQAATNDEQLLKQVGSAATGVTQALNDLLQHIKQYTTGGQPIGRYDQATDTILNVTENIFSSMGDAGEMVRQARILAQATSDLVNAIKADAEGESDLENSRKLLSAAKLLADATAKMVEAAKGAAANPDSEEQQQKLREAAEGLRIATNAAAQNAIKKKLVSKLEVSESTGLNLNYTPSQPIRLLREMVRQARILAQATSDLVNAIKADAEGESDLENSRKLLSAAKLLADATAKMVEAAKGAAANPDSEEQQQKLREAAEGLRIATNAAAQNAIKKKLVSKLENAAKLAAAAATQTIAAAQQAASTNKNPAAQQQLVQSCKAVADQIPMLVQGVRGSQSQPDSPSAQLALISAGQNFLQPGAKMVTAAKATAPTISDQASAMQLSQCAKNLATALAELRTAAQKAQEACGPLEIDNALNVVRNLEKDMQEAKASAVEGKLKPLPGETLEKSSQDLGNSTKAVSSAIAQLLSEISQGNENYTGMAARDLAQALKALGMAARGVAASTSDPQARNAMLDCASDVMDKSGNLIEETKRAVAKPGDPDSQQRLAQVAKAVSQALNRCVNCLPGQRDVDNAIRTVGEASKKLLADSFPPSSKSFQEAQGNLNQAAVGLNQSANELVQSSRGTTQDLSRASGKFGQDFNEFLQAGVEMAGQSQSKEDQTQVVTNLKTISMSSSKLLLAAKALSADPSAPNLKNQLAAAARAVTDSINQLITMCTQQAPGQKECDNALRELETVRGMLENPTEAVNDLSYFDCIDSVMENSKVLGEAMAGISHNAKNSKLPEFGNSVSSASKALCGLTEAAAQASYLVGVSDPNSHAGQRGLVDPSQFARANQSIQMACQNLVDPACTQSQVLSAATIVAKHTSALCNACRLASSKTANPVAKRQFVQSAKEVANSTANLVKTIKALDGAFSGENREKCRGATVPLIEAVDNLTAFASNPEFASVPAQISPEGLQAMKPIVVAAKTMLESSAGLIQTARSLAVNPKDPPKWSVLAGHSRTVSDSIKNLITNMRDKAPGQIECDEAIEVLNRCIRDVDQASLAAVSQQLNPRDDISQEALHDQVAAAVQEISILIEPIAVAARSEASELGHKVSQMASYFEPLIMASIGTASKILDSQQQMNLLDQTKTLAESALQMLYTAKEAGGNPKAAHTQEAVEESVLMMKEAVDDLSATLAEAASASGAVGGMVDSITQAINKIDEGPDGEPEGTFVDYQTTMVKTAKAIAVTVQEMVTKSNTNPDELGSLANQLTSEFGQLAQEAKPAAITAENQEIGSHIKNRVQELGHGCATLVTKAGALQCSPNDAFTKKELIESARKVSEKVSHVLAALQAGNRGTQACITAGSAVAGIIADLDTTIMFATAGTLNRENAETFADHRENILKTAKALVEDTKLLVSGAGASQEKLAQAAQSSVNTITKLSEVVKLGAASLGAEDPETQADSLHIQ
ncbi:UNVERIFIED_CONTAM: hypothetical protein FKN15_001239 [Acipenser sinensis]